MIQKRTQLSVLAVAALAIVALVGVALLASGGAPAQATATIIAPGVEGNSMPQPQDTPRHAAPEACPAEGQAAAVVDSGHYALFDVYWNPVEGELTNTVCPPSVVYVPEDEDEGTSARDDRFPSSIDITAEPPTIIHIPISAKVDLRAPDTPYTEDNYPDLWTADNNEDRDTNSDGTPDGVGDGMVWALPACPPDSTSTGSLCLSFSAALLDPSDWDGNIQYLLGHVHQIDIDKQDPRYTLVYDVPVGGATGELTPLWDSSNAQFFVTEVAPGEYDRPTWFFTSRGTYEFQVHIRGNPNTSKDDPVSKDESVTSDVREYIIHVGAESDLGVTTSVEPALATGDATLDPGDNVTIEITASNAGPDTAPSAKVDVALPEGLTYSSHNTATGTTTTPTPASGHIGELGVTNDENSSNADHHGNGGCGNSWEDVDHEGDDFRHRGREDHGDRKWRENREDIPCAGAGPDSGQQHGYGHDHGGDQRQRGPDVPGHAVGAGEFAGWNQRGRPGRSEGAGHRRHADLRADRRRRG